MSIAASTGKPAEIAYNANKRPFAADENWGGKGGKGGKVGHGSGKGGKGGFGGKRGGKGGKGGQFGGGKGKGMDQCAAFTPEGKRICFSFNNSQVRCKRKGCIFEHVCGRCFQKHPIYQCRGNGGKVPETQGSGLPSL